MGGRGVPLGCLPEPDYDEDDVELEPGATLLLYTDGLTERRGESMDAALDQLRQALAACAGEDLETVLDRAVASAGPEVPADDVALVALRFTGAVAVQRLELPAVLGSVPRARHALRDWLAARNIAGLAAADILLAAGEAMANAVEHSGSDGFELEFAMPVRDSVHIAVRDRGEWKEPVVAPHRGRGFSLMRSLMDECTVEHGADGTVIDMVRRVERAEGPVEPPPMPESCRVVLDQGIARLAGELDLACADAVRAQLVSPALHTVDLSAVTHVDSTGARMLFGLPNRPVFIAPPGSASRRTLELSALTDAMTVRDA